MPTRTALGMTWHDLAMHRKQDVPTQLHSDQQVTCRAVRSVRPTAFPRTPQRGHALQQPPDLGVDPVARAALSSLAGARGCGLPAGRRGPWRCGGRRRPRPVDAGDAGDAGTAECTFGLTGLGAETVLFDRSIIRQGATPTHSHACSTHSHSLMTWGEIRAAR